MELEGKGLVNESQAKYLLPGRNVVVTTVISSLPKRLAELILK